MITVLRSLQRRWGALDQEAFAEAGGPDPRSFHNDVAGSCDSL